MARKRLLAVVCTFAVVCLALATCQAAGKALPEILANDNHVAAGQLHDGVLTLHLEVREGLWHPGAEDGTGGTPEMPGAIDTYSFAEEGRAPQTPGPLIRVPQGTELDISAHNLLAVPVYIHGLNQHPGDGYQAIELAPGEIKEVRFAAGEPGSYIYWASTTKSERPPHADSLTAIRTRADTDGAMSGAFIVDRAGGTTSDHIFVIGLWAKNVFHPNIEGVLTINGKMWPYTERVQAILDRPEHWRVLNASPLEHPMHLHGFFYHVTAVGDGESERYFSSAEAPMVVTESVGPGHTYDMTWTPDRPGNWIFHCHILDHMSNYFSPVLYGPEGPPPALKHAREGYGAMGMSKLVIGITVTGGARLVPAKAAVAPVAAERHLFVRERPASQYVPAGPGFYLEGVSKEVEAIGPPLVITRGQRTAITITNELNEPTAIHWHGMEIESTYDGVPGWSGAPGQMTHAIAPGTSYVAYMTPPRTGTFIYHTHWRDVAQLTGGLYGPLLVLEPGQKYDPATDKTFVLGRSGPNEFHDPLVLNGTPQPGLMVLLLGGTYRFRLINITPNDSRVATSLTLEGHPVKWRAIGKDGADLPPAQASVRDAAFSISVGETYDFEFAPKQRGMYSLRFASPFFGREVAQDILVVPSSAPVSVYADKH